MARVQRRGNPREATKERLVQAWAMSAGVCTGVCTSVLLPGVGARMSMGRARDMSMRMGYQRGAWGTSVGHGARAWAWAWAWAWA